jgi:uncharacterized membrane protein
MRLSLLPSRVSLLLTSLLVTLPSLSSALRIIESKSLNPCQTNSQFTASLFNVAFTPDNNTLAFDVVGVSSIDGNVTAELEVIAYGFTALRQKLDPCAMNLQGMCPMNTGQIDIQSNINISDDVIKRIPGIAYQVPDLDGVVRIYINNTQGQQLACVEAELSNGKSVDQPAVGWITAVIAGLGLIASAVTSGLGHSNTAAHVAANALSLFGYFQAQAMIGMTSVPLPPIVQSWTQNFDWSMGIIRVQFMQKAITWYVASTGGTPTNLLSELSTVSVEIQKRSVEVVHKLFVRAYKELVSRSNAASTSATTDVNKTVIVSGIKRVAFRAAIEISNLFMTGLVFFIIFAVFVALAVAGFKGFCEFAVKSGWMKRDKFQDFRHGWLTVLKGIMYRIVVIGYPQMCVLCLWELTVRDSAAAVILALVFWLFMTAILVWASLKVIRIAKRSVSMHKNPAYILYSDPKALNRWGFLYVQFRATAYYFVVPVLVYTVVKGMFIAFGQTKGVVQAVALILIEAAYLVAVSVIRPWMDKRTNIFNICICVVNFVNVVFLLVFTNVFKQPGLVTGVMGVVFFVINAVFALVLLLLVLISSIYALASKNPDTRYQPMRDDRASFIKSQSQMAIGSTELDALGATARGDYKPYKRHSLDDDDSYSSDSLSRQQNEASNMPLPPSTANSGRAGSGREPPHSPVDPSVPLFPSDGRNDYHNRPQYNMGHDGSRPNSDLPLLAPGMAPPRSQNASPVPRQQYGYNRGPGTPTQGYRRQQGGPNQWQVGAGYDH